jgi:hypothetical protein
MTSSSLVRIFGAALLINFAAGCGGSSPAAGAGSAGSSGGTTASGQGGTSASGTGGTTGAGGTSASGSGGTTGGGGTIGSAGSTGGTAASGVGGVGGTSATGGTTGVGGGKVPVGSAQCSDGKDNDGDGKIDYDDPECVGPLDNDESSFATGIPGDNMDECKQDCFFDGNSGAGDDGCDWQLQCDPTSVNTKCPYDMRYVTQHPDTCSTSASQSQACINFCRKFVPNGCDCFGCCIVPGASTPIKLAPTCTAADFGNPAKCPVCTQVTQCSNPCDRCEICIGKPTIPADCNAPDAGTDGPPPPSCGSDFQPCGPGTNTTICPTGQGCVTGCCLPINP